MPAAHGFVVRWSEEMRRKDNRPKKKSCLPTWSRVRETSSKRLKDETSRIRVKTREGRIRSTRCGQLRGAKNRADHTDLVGNGRENMR